MTPEPLEPGASPGPGAVPAAGGERRLHPWSWLFVLAGALRQFIVPLLVLVFIGGRSQERYQLAAAGVAVLGLAAASVARYFTYRYRIDGDSLFVRSGLFERELRQIPFSRIHNVALHQSLLHRLFGVAEVRLESAAGARPEAEMKVLSLADALALEQLIRHRGQAPAQPGEQPGATEAGDTLLSLPAGELVRLGLISNRGMVVVAGAFAAAWQLFPEERMVQLLRAVTRAVFGYVGIATGNWLQTAAGAVFLVVLALLLLRAFLVLLAFVRYHGFRLGAHGRRLTVERGLFSRVRSSVPRRRIQAWTLREGLLHRLFRRRSLTIDTATSQSEPGQEKPLHELAPVATPEACDALVRHVLPGAQWPPAQWHPLHPRAWLRLLCVRLLWGVVLLAIGLRLSGAWGLLALAWLPWSWLAARRHAAFAGYAVDGGIVAVRQGWWSRHWRFAELDKLQAIQLRRSPLDRLAGMASLWLDTAGAGPMSPPLRIRFLPLAEARSLMARLEREVARRPLRW